MCYTIEVYLSRKAIEERFSVDTSALNDFEFRYFYSAFNNPYLPVVTQDNPDSIQLMQWGLIPGWVKDMKQASQIRTATYNARAESLQEKASFRKPLRSGRCWVIGHGFFEWQHFNNRKAPWYIRLSNNRPFAFAGLYDQWVDPETGEILKTFTVVTTKANPLLEKIHNTKKRMPVILNEQVESHWIDPGTEFSKVKLMLTPFDEQQLTAYPVARNALSVDSDPRNIKVIERAEFPEDLNLFDTHN